MMVPRRFHVVYRKTLSGYEHALNNTHVFQQELFSSNFFVFIKEMVSVYSWHILNVFLTLANLPFLPERKMILGSSLGRQQYLTQ